MLKGTVDNTIMELSQLYLEDQSFVRTRVNMLQA